MTIAVVTAGTGWIVVSAQVASDGWSHGGTVVLLGLALAATLGVVLVGIGARQRRPAWTGLGLILVAMSPTVFAYVLNLGALVVGGYELSRAFPAVRRGQPR